MTKLKKDKNEEMQRQSCSIGCGCRNESAGEKERKKVMEYLPAIVSFVFLATGLILDNIQATENIFTGGIRMAWYAVAYLIVGIPVLSNAAKLIGRGDLFNEFSLMSVASLCAFAIGEYPEGVAVMLFYSAGELIQDAAVNRSKRNIKALLDVRPDAATVLRGGEAVRVDPESVSIGETIEVKAGEKVSLDGIMLSPFSSFNTAALTGESRPKIIREGAKVLAGMVNLDRVVNIKVDKKYADCSLSRILEMVQEATQRKAKTELLIRRFAKIYTPIVFLLAVVIVLLPMFLVDNYVYTEWLYKALIFLVISCPCALVVSIPLGYFGGIGAASRNGILFKGANYLDKMTHVDTVVMDKTGTLTEGVFKVHDIVPAPTFDKERLIGIAAAIERGSTHPVAKAISDFATANEVGRHTSTSGKKYSVSGVEEIAGYGLRGMVDGLDVAAGNTKLMDKIGITYDDGVNSVAGTTVVLAVDGHYAGYISITDEIRKDAASAVAELRRMGIETVMLSGDKRSVTEKTAAMLGIDKAYGELLPEDKVKRTEELKAGGSRMLAFVGDGINDAPVLALSDVGIAMGGMGSDAAIETADVIIQTDQPSRIPIAIRIAKATQRIVIENIVLAFAVKTAMMVLGVFGMTTIWGAVFADVGVALLAILNATRMLAKRY